MGWKRGEVASAEISDITVLLSCCITTVSSALRGWRSKVCFGGLGGWGGLGLGLGLGAPGLDGPSAPGNRPEPCQPSIRKLRLWLPSGDSRATSPRFQ